MIHSDGTCVVRIEPSMGVGIDVGEGCAFVWCLGVHGEARCIEPRAEAKDMSDWLLDDETDSTVL